MITKADKNTMNQSESTGNHWRLVGELVIEGTGKDATYSMQDIVELPIAEVVGEPTANDIKALINGKELASELTADEITAVLSLYKPWIVGEVLQINDLRSYTGKLYRVVQAHTSQTDWNPAITPALFVDTAPAGIVPD